MHVDNNSTRANQIIFLPTCLMCRRQGDNLLFFLTNLYINELAIELKKWIMVLIKKKCIYYYTLTIL